MTRSKMPFTPEFTLSVSLVVHYCSLRCQFEAGSRYYLREKASKDPEGVILVVGPLGVCSSTSAPLSSKEKNDGKNGKFHTCSNNE